MSRLEFGTRRFRIGEGIHPDVEEAEILHRSREPIHVTHDLKPTGRIYRQDYVLFLRAMTGKIAFLREYFDPVRAAKALDAPILGLES